MTDIGLISLDKKFNINARVPYISKGMTSHPEDLFRRHLGLSTSMQMQLPLTPLNK